MSKNNTIKKTGDIYKNPLGNMTAEELWNLKKLSKEEIEEFHKSFRVTTTKCPPVKIKPKHIICFHCKECFVESLQNVRLKDIKAEDKK